MINHTNECPVVTTGNCNCTPNGRDRELLAVIEENMRESWMDGYKTGFMRAKDGCKCAGS